VKFAIYEPEPMVCGPMVWASHLREGMRRLGHECDVLTFTRSGQPKKAWVTPDKTDSLRWRAGPPDVTARYRDAREVLSGYDGIILNDARTVLHDRGALIGMSYLETIRPDYLVVLERGRVPFTFALHGNAYPPKELPFVEELVDLPGFTGTAVTHSPLANQRGMELWPRVEWINAPLPYVPRVETVDAPPPDDVATRAVGITGRYTSTKGHHALAFAAAHGYLPSAVAVRLWGSAVVNRAPSPTFLTFEQLTKTMGLNGWRDEAPVTKAAPWTVMVGNNHVSYAGGYRDGVLVATGLSVHVDLTAARYSAGAVEFSQLEAIDAGRAQVSVSSMWDERFHGLTVPAVDHWPGDSRLATDETLRGPLELVGRTVESVLSWGPDLWRQSVTHNRHVLREVHDPAKVASAYVDALTAKR
jgi:hypothetical protein